MSVLSLDSGLVVIAVARRLYVVVCVLQCVGGFGCVAMRACAVVQQICRCNVYCGVRCGWWHIQCRIAVRGGDGRACMLVWVCG